MEILYQQADNFQFSIFQSFNFSIFQSFNLSIFQSFYGEARSGLIQRKINVYLEVIEKKSIFAARRIENMIKLYETKEEKVAAFKRSLGLRKVWNDLTSGKMSMEEFQRQGYKTVHISK